VVQQNIRALLRSGSADLKTGCLDPEIIATIVEFLGDIKHVVFVPHAVADKERDGYTQEVRDRFASFAIKVSDLRHVSPHHLIPDETAIFVGGGNTYRLLDALKQSHIKWDDIIRDKVQSGVRYIGTSAGTNLACPTIKTTNDMPIVYPISPIALGLVWYQINPHYQDPDPSSTHMGETREERIKEFHEENDIPVIGLREGSWIRVKNDRSVLCGSKTARLFLPGEVPLELDPGCTVESVIYPVKV